VKAIDELHWHASVNSKFDPPASAVAEAMADETAGQEMPEAPGCEAGRTVFKSLSEIGFHRGAGNGLGWWILP